MKRAHRAHIAVACAAVLTAAAAGFAGMKLAKRHTQRTISSTMRYAAPDIRTACDAVEQYFADNLPGITLLKLRYDESVERQMLSQQNRAEAACGDDAIVIHATFQTGATARNYGFLPYTTYTDWPCMLIRSADGSWHFSQSGL